MLDLNKKLVQLNGKPFKRSFPDSSEEEVQEETVTNVILNCLAAFPVREKREIFLVNHLAEKILSAPDGKVELTDSETAFIEDVLFTSTFQRDKKGEVNGVYLAPLIAQVMEAAGIEK